MPGVEFSEEILSVLYVDSDYHIRSGKACGEEIFTIALSCSALCCIMHLCC